MITRRDAFAVLGLTALGLALPARAHHGGDVEAKALGAADAPITMIEYSSLTCPHCASFHNETLPRIRERYIEPGKVRLVYRDFPFDRTALFAAALAHCAGPERYFGVLEVLFRAQKTWARADEPRAALERIGRLGGLKREDIRACFEDRGLLDGILAMRIEGAETYDVSSTPTFIINGEKVVGAQPYERFEEVFERLLRNL